MAKSYESSAYSFGDVSVTITGPNLSAIVTGAAEEGISIDMDGDSAALVMGADGSGMYSVRVAQNGTITIRVLKASPFNQILKNAFYFQRGSTVNTGRNVIVVSDIARSDLVTAVGCGFQKMPNLTFAMAPGINEWPFLCQRITSNLGPGISTAIAS